MSVAATSPHAWAQYLPSKEILHAGLLGFTLAAAILSSIPSLRMAGSLYLRSVSLATASLNAWSTSYGEHWTGRLAKCTKVALIALGIAGLVLGLPALVIAPIAADCAVQLLLAIDGVLKNNPFQVNFALATLIVNILFCIALILSSPGVMFAALSVNMVSMCAGHVLSFALTEGKLRPLNRASLLHILHGVVMLGLCMLSLLNMLLLNWDKEYRPWLEESKFDTIVDRPPLDPALYPTLPLSGPTVTTCELK